MPVKTGCYNCVEINLNKIWWLCQVSTLIPHPVASEHCWLVKAPRWIHSAQDVSVKAVVTLRLPCAIVESPRRHKRAPFVNIAFLRSRSIKRRQWKHKMDYYGVVFAHLATRCGINVKDPLGAGFRSVNPALEVLRDLEIWWMTLKNNRAPFLYYIKLWAYFKAIGTFNLELQSGNT